LLRLRLGVEARLGSSPQAARQAPLAEARGFHAQPLGHSDPRGASPYQGCGWQARRDCACARPQGIAPALAVCERALDSVWTARASLRNSLALALRSGDRGSPRDIFRAARYALDSRTKSRRCNPSPSTALPIIQDDGAGPFISGTRLQWQFKDEACGVLARHSSRNYEEARASSSGVWEIAFPGDALRTPGMNAGARRAFWSPAGPRLGERRDTGAPTAPRRAASCAAGLTAACLAGF
jgi:hypothetical protein